MNNKTGFILRRRLRRYIAGALTGMALGAGLVVVPAYANPTPTTTTVDNTSASGAGSLSDAITAVNASPVTGNIINFSTLASGASFATAQPSITNDVTISQAGLNSFSVTDGLGTSGSGYLHLVGSGTSGGYGITTDLTANDNSTIKLNAAFGLTGNVTANDDSEIDISAAAGITGNATTNGNSFLHVWGGGSIGGDITANDGSEIEMTSSFLKGNATATGNSITGDSPQISLTSTNVGTVDSLTGVLQSGTGNVTATNGGTFAAANSYIYGNATISGFNRESDKASEMDLAGGSIGTINAGVLQSGTGDLADNGGALVAVAGTYIYGNATVAGAGGGAASQLLLAGSSIGTINAGVLQDGTGDLTVTDSGTVTAAGTYIYGNASVDGAPGQQSWLDIADSSVGTINSGVLQDGTGDITATNGGLFSVLNSYIYGNATADGASGQQSRINITGSSVGTINSGVLQNGTGDITATDGGIFDLTNSYVYGNATADGVNSALGQESDIQLNSSSVGTINSGVLQDGTGDVTLTNGGSLEASESFIYGNVNVSGNSYVSLNNSSVGTINADVLQNGTGNLVAGGTSELELLGGSSIYGNVTMNDSSLLRTSGANFLNNGSATTTLGTDATFAPDVTQEPLTVNALSLNNSLLRPWVSMVPPLEVPVTDAENAGPSNSIAIIDYNSITGTFNPDVVSPFDVGIDYTNTSGPGEVRLYLQSNQVNFDGLPGNQNEHALAGYLGNYVNSLQTNPDYFSLENLPEGNLSTIVEEVLAETAYDGNLNVLNHSGLDIFSTHNMQAYWNQKSFVDSIRANLANDSDNNGGASNFALNQASSVGSAPAQLASLNQAMTPSYGALGVEGSNGSSSNRGVWASYNGNHQNTDADGGVGSEAWDSSTDGFTLGYTNGGDRFSWGVAAGHQKSTLDFAGEDDSGTQDGWNMGLYASLKGKSAYLNGILGYGSYDNQIYGESESSFKNKATSASLELGKHLDENKHGGFTPYASVLWTRVKQDAGVSDNEFGANLEGDSNSVLTTELGLRFNHRIYDVSGTLKGGWQAGLAWLHQGGDTGFASTLGVTGVPGSFSLQTTPLAGDSAVVQLGAYGRIHGNLIGFAGYQGTFGSNQNINAVNAGVGYQF